MISLDIKACISCSRDSLPGYRKCKECRDGQRRRAVFYVATRIQAGLCVHCGKNPSKEGVKRCVICLTKASLKRKNIKASGLCRCGKLSERGVGKICLTCLSAAKRHRLRLIQRGSCHRCGTPSDGKQLCTRCSKIHSDAKKRRTNERRTAVFNAYGEKCQCSKCDEKNHKFLTIDHKNNDGGAHRRSTKFGSDLYMWIIKNNFPNFLQLLCWNCNMAKRTNGGICPHVQ
jgi:hypothetical protein